MFEQLFHSWAYTQGIPYPITEIFIPHIYCCLFMKTKNWNQPNCLPTDQWIMKTIYLYIYKMEYYTIQLKRKAQKNLQDNV